MSILKVKVMPGAGLGNLRLDFLGTTIGKPWLYRHSPAWLHAQLRLSDAHRRGCKGAFSPRWFVTGSIRRGGVVSRCDAETPVGGNPPGWRGKELRRFRRRAGEDAVISAA